MSAVDRFRCIRIYMGFMLLQIRKQGKYKIILQSIHMQGVIAVFKLCCWSRDTEKRMFGNRVVKLEGRKKRHYIH